MATPSSLSKLFERLRTELLIWLFEGLRAHGFPTENKLIMLKYRSGNAISDNSQKFIHKEHLEMTARDQYLLGQ